jgi:hypothetical protein
MSIHTYGLLAGATAILIWTAGPAQAISEQECSAKYRAAKSAGTLDGMEWNAFRKAECSADNTVFPVAISPQYANQPLGEAREQTCLDQYNANKANGGNAGLDWIEKGGGYFSECDKRLGGN